MRKVFFLSLIMVSILISCNETESDEIATSDICVKCTEFEDPYGYIWDSVQTVVQFGKIKGYYVLGKTEEDFENYWFSMTTYIICNQSNTDAIKSQLDSIYNVYGRTQVRVLGMVKQFICATGGDKNLPYRNDSIEFAGGVTVYKIEPIDTSANR